MRREARHKASFSAAETTSSDKSGDFSADFAASYRQHYSPLVSWLHAVFGPGPPEPEDVAQRAFASLAKRGVLSDIKNLKAFLWRSAQNIVISEKRQETTRATAEPELETVFSQPEGNLLDPERVLESKDVLRAMVEAVQKMPTQRRRVFVMFRIDGLTHAEIGRRLGISRTAVHKHVVRAGLEISSAYQAHQASNNKNEAAR